MTYFLLPMPMKEKKEVDQCLLDVVGADTNFGGREIQNIYLSLLIYKIRKNKMRIVFYM